MRFSPRLKMAADVIKAMLHKYDIAGVVVLHAPGFSEYILKVDPSYSVVKVTGSALRLRTTGLDLTPAQKRARLKDTANMANLLFTTTTEMAMQLQQITLFVDEATGAEHLGGSHTSQEELDN